MMHKHSGSRNATRTGFVDAGRREEAAEHYLNGLAVAESNDFRMLQGELLARLGEVESDRSQRMNYLQRSLSLFGS